MGNRKRILSLAGLGFVLGTTQLIAGGMDVIWNRPTGSHGSVPISASIQNTVSLKIEDAPSGGGNLTSQSGINFGNVNSSGTTEEVGVKGTANGEVGHYEAQFSLTASRSGNGNISLHCRRSSGGNFNARDGIEIDDHRGVLRPLPALHLHGVSVLENVSPGTYDKRIAINIYPSDKGVLKGVLQFTLCSL